MNLSNKTSTASRLHCELALLLHHFRNISLNATAAPQVSLLMFRGRRVQMTVNHLEHRSGCYSVPFSPTLSNAVSWEWTNSVNIQSEGELFIRRALGEQCNKHPTVVVFPCISQFDKTFFFLKKEENPESGLVFFLKDFFSFFFLNQV